MLVDDTGDGATFGEYRSRARRRAHELVERGVDPASTVCWQLPNTVEAMVWFGALSILGTRQAPIPIVGRVSEIAGVLRLARPHVMVTASRWRGLDHDQLAAEAARSVKHDVVLIDGTAPLKGTSWDLASPRKSRARYLYATSGSTGAAKLAQHSDASLLAWVRNQSHVQGIEPDDVVAYPVSLTHIAGAHAVGQALVRGNSALLLNGYEPGRTTAAMRRAGTTIVMGVPSIYSALVAEQRSAPASGLLPRLRYCCSGAAPKPPNLHADVRAALGGRGLVTSYGMTEAGAICVGSPDSTDEQLEDTVGRPAPGLTLRVVGPDGRDLDVGGVGELRVRGMGVFTGYSDSTSDGEAFDEEGFLRTGDLGAVRPDGYVQIRGRLKDVIIRKGENIVPSEVVAALHAIPAVRDAVVLGLPDPVTGERVCAVVAIAPGAALNLAGVAAACRARGLMAQKIPELLFLVDEMPRTATGKTDLLQLRAELNRAGLAPNV